MAKKLHTHILQLKVHAPKRFSAAKVASLLNTINAKPLTSGNAVIVKGERVRGNPASKVRVDVSKWYPRGDGTTWGRIAIAAIASANEEYIQEQAERMLAKAA